MTSHRNSLAHKVQPRAEHKNHLTLTAAILVAAAVFSTGADASCIEQSTQLQQRLSQEGQAVVTGGSDAENPVTAKMADGKSVDLSAVSEPAMPRESWMDPPISDAALIERLEDAKSLAQDNGEKECNAILDEVKAAVPKIAHDEPVTE